MTGLSGAPAAGRALDAGGEGGLGGVAAKATAVANATAASRKRPRRTEGIRGWGIGVESDCKPAVSWFRVDPVPARTLEETASVDGGPWSTSRPPLRSPGYHVLTLRMVTMS